MSESDEKDSKKNENINNEEKKIKSDLDLLSEDLPKKKLKKKNKNELMIPEINFDQLIPLKNIEEEGTLIKPSNLILNISNINKSKLHLLNNNKSLLNRIGNNHKFFNNKKIQKKKKKSSFLDNFNYNVSNLVQPINHRKNFSMNEKEDYITLGVENLKKKMTTVQKKYPVYSSKKNKRNQSYKYNYEPITNTDDYFFSLFKDFSSQNKSLHNLDKKVYKVSHKDLDNENDEGKNEKKRTKNYKSEEKKYEFDPKNNLLENIGIVQYNITTATKEYEKKMKENNSNTPNELKEKKRKIFREKRHSVVIDNRLMQLFKMNNDLNEIEINNTKNEKKKENKKSEENSESDIEDKK